MCECFYPISCGILEFMVVILCCVWLQGIADVSATPTEDAPVTIHRMSPGCEGIDLPELLGRVRRTSDTS